MNRKQAIKILNETQCPVDSDNLPFWEAVDMAIKALEKIESIKFNAYAINELLKEDPEDPAEGEKITKWNTHKVACLLAELFGDTCACNYNNIDEWLPNKCDFAKKECPNVVGVACWEQFLKHRK